ncbi:MAG: glycoside hydrolase family 130 protein [Sedimentisphaerales bacterium]|nr:glycoside hydrolase family 130 protein [Sedimentisphaerales bacterium]
MYRIAPKTGQDVVRRYKYNPLISIDDLPFGCSDIWNAGVIHFQGRYLLLLTVETLEGQGCIYLAHGTDGYKFTVEPEPFMVASADEAFARYETFGIFDPRITEIDSTYYITYLAESEYGRRIGLARTDDFKSVERIQYISEPDTKSACLFTSKIEDCYAMLERPSAGVSIWLSYSNDLIHWGSSTVVLTPRGGFWDSNRVGAAGPPIEIEQGWLLIYYGEKDTSAGSLIRLGAAILQKDNPSNVLGRSNIPILAPREKYERIGDVGNIVFSCGALLEEDGRLKIYYGASDSCICLGVTSLDEIIQICINDQEQY